MSSWNYCFNCIVQLDQDGILPEPHMKQEEYETQEVFICRRCHKKVLKNKMFLELQTIVDNKRVHFSNLLKKLDHFSHLDYKEEIEKIDKYLKKYNISIHCLNTQFLSEFLKPKNYSFISLLQLCLYFRDRDFCIDAELKSQIILLFNNFIRFNVQTNYQRKNLSYEILFFFIFKILDIEIYLKPNHDKFISSSQMIESFFDFLRHIEKNKKDFTRNYETVISDDKMLTTFGSYLESYLKKQL